MTDQLDNIEIFTDGACRGNPGPGGWGIVLKYRNHKKYFSGSEKNTTNNRMELTAIINALKMVKKNLPIIVTTDSQYVKKGITTWIFKWKKNNWKTSNKNLVKNKDLWKQLDIVVLGYNNITWTWIKGHSGHCENELADKLANLAIDNLLLQKDKQ